jgi:hypothetical protein
MTSRTRRDQHFRPEFKIDKRPKVKIKVPGWGPRKMAVLQGPLDINEIAYRTGLKSAKAVAQECRAGRLPMWRFDRVTGRVLWHRLEFEAWLYWQRAQKVRGSFVRDETSLSVTKLKK